MAAINLRIEPPRDNPYARRFCDEFVHLKRRPKYLFGRNIYADRIVRQIDITGFIDDYSSQTEFLGKPIVKLEHVPKNALILILSGGRPFTAQNRVKAFGLEHLDYFMFYKYSGLSLEPVMFLDGFAEDFQENRSQYEGIYRLLRDDVSREQYCKLVNFKLSYDLDHLKGFAYLEHKQYFEPFLGLKEEGEVFADVGGFDGYTSHEFIRRCPRYRWIHFFEPNAKNLSLAEEKLKKHERISFHRLGLSNKKETLRFSSNGSASKMCQDGQDFIRVNRLDDVLHEPVTFMKMDIEGAESRAIEGAAKTLEKCHPKLAVCIYHKTGDFWRIPEQVFAIRDDYDVYLRHYTESIYETVMFFVPLP